MSFNFLKKITNVSFQNHLLLSNNLFIQIKPKLCDKDKNERQNKEIYFEKNSTKKKKKNSENFNEKNHSLKNRYESHLKNSI